MPAVTSTNDGVQSGLLIGTAMATSSPSTSMAPPRLSSRRGTAAAGPPSNSRPAATPASTLTLLDTITSTPCSENWPSRRRSTNSARLLPGAHDPGRTPGAGTKLNAAPSPASRTAPAGSCARPGHPRPRPGKREGAPALLQHAGGRGQAVLLGRDQQAAEQEQPHPPPQHRA